MPKVNVAWCPTCESDQHVTSQTDEKLFLGCGHEVDAPKPKPAEK